HFQHMSNSERRLIVSQLRQIDTAHRLGERPPACSPTSRSKSTHLQFFPKSFGKLLYSQRCSPLRLKARCSANSARRLPGRGRFSSASMSAWSSTGPCRSIAAGCRRPSSCEAATEAASGSSNVECAFMLLLPFGGLDAQLHVSLAVPEKRLPICQCR